MSNNRRIGLFGGAFDPVHQMHITLALEARSQLELEEVWILIDKQPRGKSTITPYENRLEMMKLATSEYDFIVVDRLQMQQNGRTHDHATILGLRQQYPEVEFFMIMGIDTFLHFPKWEFPEVFCSNATFAIAERPPHDQLLIHKVKAELGKHADALACQMIDLEPTELSSSLIRDRLLSNVAVEAIHPDVNEYIRLKQLYGTT